MPEHAIGFYPRKTICLDIPTSNRFRGRAEGAAAPPFSFLYFKKSFVLTVFQVVLCNHFKCTVAALYSQGHIFGL